MEPRGERREKAPDGRVREALPAELDSLAPVLARAFERDPVYRWIVPDDARWRRVAPGLFRELLRLFAATGTVLTDDTAAGAALWNPPEPRRRSLRERAAFALALCVRLRVATPRLARVGGILSSLDLPASSPVPSPSPVKSTDL